MPVTWPWGTSLARSTVMEPGPQPTSRIVMFCFMCGMR